MLLRLLVRLCRARADVAMARASRARWAMAVVAADPLASRGELARLTKLAAIEMDERARAHEWMDLAARVEAL